METGFYFSGGQYGNRLLFASVAVNTTMVLSKTGQTEGLKVYQHWENFIQQRVCQEPIQAVITLPTSKSMSGTNTNRQTVITIPTSVELG